MAFRVGHGLRGRPMRARVGRRLRDPAGLGHEPTKTDRALEALGAAIGFEIVRESRRHREDKS